MKRALKNTKNTPIQSLDSLWNFDGQSPITLTGVAFYTAIPDCVKIICNTTPKNLIPYLISLYLHTPLYSQPPSSIQSAPKVQFFSLERKCLRCSRFAENGPRDKKNAFLTWKKTNKNTYKLLLRYFFWSGCGAKITSWKCWQMVLPLQFQQNPQQHQILLFKWGVYVLQ